MATAFDSIVEILKRKVAEHAGSGARGGGILGQLTQIVRQRSGSKNAARNVRPASEDPYGDPADEKGARNIRPASEDPYGDPADQKR